MHLTTPTQFFHQLVAMDRQRIQGNLQDFLIGGGIHVTVRRNHIYEDAFTALAQEEGGCCPSYAVFKQALTFSDMRQKLRVTFTNAQGLDEAGIDGGGLFREFLSQLLKTGFDPNHGFFTPSPDGLLYPNPKVRGGEERGVGGRGGEGGGREGKRGGWEGGEERGVGGRGGEGGGREGRRGGWEGGEERGVGGRGGEGGGREERRGGWEGGEERGVGGRGGEGGGREGRRGGWEGGEWEFVPCLFLSLLMSTLTTPTSGSPTERRLSFPLPVPGHHAREVPL